MTTIPRTGERCECDGKKVDEGRGEWIRRNHRRASGIYRHANRPRGMPIYVWRSSCFTLEHHFSVQRPVILTLALSLPQCHTVPPNALSCACSACLRQVGVVERLALIPASCSAGSILTRRYCLLLCDLSSPTLIGSLICSLPYLSDILTRH